MVNRYHAFFFRFRYSKLYAETWRETESSCYSSQNSDDDVQDFFQKVIFFHKLWCMMFDLWVNHPNGNSELTTQNNMSTNPVSILILSSKLEGARRFKHFSIEKPPVLHILTDSVVLSVRNRTRIVRIRTLFCTPYFRLFIHYQAINVLARFLLYNKYSNEQILVSLKHD